MTPTRFVRPALAAAAVLAVAAAAACSPVSTTEGGPGSGSSVPAPGPADATPRAVELSANVKDEAADVGVDKIITVSAEHGIVSKVSLTADLTDRQGKQVKDVIDGKFNADKTSWTAAEALAPGASYTVKMTGSNAAGTARTTTWTFTTENLSLSQQAYPKIQPTKGDNVGVGMPVILQFDTPIKDKAEFQRHLSVTATPQQTGTWSWLSSTEVHYRPKSYWKPGTKVSVTANLRGVNAGNGVYGQKSVATSFTVDRSLVTKVDLQRDVAKVYRDGKKVRTIPVSAGKPGWETRSGTSLIKDKEYNKVMTNEMIGAKEKYRLIAKYALRITDSGEFLHSAPWNTWSFGVRNASHGCIGMSIADSGWLYDRTLLGDPVVVTGTSKPLHQGNGWADWNISYQEFQKGSAL